MTITMERDFNSNFEYYKENCENFKKTELSDDVYALWSERCWNFKKKNVHSSVSTCWNCKYLNVKKKSN